MISETTNYTETRRNQESILEDARTFYKNELGSRPANYHDYEKFKRILHDNGWFGSEFKLAKILHL